MSSSVTAGVEMEVLTGSVMAKAIAMAAVMFCFVRILCSEEDLVLKKQEKKTSVVIPSLFRGQNCSYAGKASLSVSDEALPQRGQE
jgi:hypothetical protein